jgi:squalene synthase HpnC
MRIDDTSAATRDSLALANTHYENFPVASFLLPMHLRKPIGLVYSFARQADDFADEGDIAPELRLQLLDGFRKRLDLIGKEATPDTAFFIALQGMIRERELPLQPFYDLLDAFSQDVVKSRYENFDEVLDYCRRSANPIGRLMLYLYGAATPANLAYADAICSALQVINFLQDVEIDYKKDRIYFPLDEMQKYRIDEQQIAAGDTGGAWQEFMAFEIDRVHQLLKSGAPLGLILPGRMGLEMRSIIAGGERILQKLRRSHGDMFNHRPILKPQDWAYMLFRAVTRT